MKYLIKESHLNNLIFKYLDNLKFVSVEDRGDIYLWESRISWSRSGYPLISTHIRYNDAYVSCGLLEELSNFFPVSLDESLIIIGEWFKYRYGFESLTRFYSDCDYD